MKIKNRKYIFLVALEISLLTISEVIDKIWQVSQIEIANNIGLIVLALPLWLLLFGLRKEKLQPLFKLIVEFSFLILSISLPASLVLMFIG